MKQNQDPTIQNVRTLIAAIEHSFNMHLAINDYTGSFYSFIPTENSFHSNLCCKEIKQSPECNEQCRVFDTITVPSLLNKNRKIIIKYCHSLLFEFAYPIINGEILLGTIFLGPFSILGKRDISYYTQKQSNETLYINKGFLSQNVPAFSAQRIEEVKIVAEILLKELSRLLLDTDNTLANKEAMSVSDKINRYVSMHFSKKIQLHDLANYLALSESRTSEILRKEYGDNFPHLLNTYRIQHAQLLLKSSSFCVPDIAERSGFTDCTYFHQVFKKYTGTTPSRYRAQTTTIKKPLHDTKNQKAKRNTNHNISIQS